MAGWTNRGKYFALDVTFRNATEPTNYYVMLCTSATAPAATTNTVNDLTQVPTGNGYTDGGFQLTPNGTDFDTLTEDDTANRASIQIKDVVWTASGGTLPASGDGARYAVLTDDHTTTTSREVYWYFDLTSDRKVSDGQTLTLQDCEARVNES